MDGVLYRTALPNVTSSPLGITLLQSLTPTYFIKASICYGLIVFFFFLLFPHVNTASTVISMEGLYMYSLSTR